MSSLKLPLSSKHSLDPFEAGVSPSASFCSFYLFIQVVYRVRLCVQIVGKNREGVKFAQCDKSLHKR